MARLSSSISDPASGLFGFLERGDVAAAVGDEAWLRAILDFEAALARAEARAGVIPADAADAIARAAAGSQFDAAALGREAAGSGNPAAPLVVALTEAVGGDAAKHVHLGATSQDAMDTAEMLVARRAAAVLSVDLDAACDAAARLADEHRSTIQTGRTLLQPALPTTFGATCAGWLSGMDSASGRLLGAVGGAAVELGGAVGTLASLGPDGPRVLEYLARELDLAEPATPWHTERGRVVAIAAALGEVAGAAGKVALDIVLLSQADIAEVREGTPGGSSTMPQKRNAVAAVLARAAAARAPGLVATLFAAMPQELQRGAGPWHVEWQALSDLFRAAGSAVAWLCESLEHLEVDAERMRRNVDAAGGVALAEHVTTLLAPSLGRMAAHRLVERAASESLSSGRAFADVLEATPEIAAHLDRAAIDGALDPAGYLGSAALFVDRALVAHAAALAARRDAHG